MNKYRALIVDDEALARESLKIALSSFREIEVIGECADGYEALKSIKEQKPDVIFLDIQMPTLDGFDVVELLGKEAPYIVFVTAYDEYALKAFEAHALDYLLKPAKVERLAKTMERVRERLQAKKRQPVEEFLRFHQMQQTPLL